MTKEHSKYFLVGMPIDGNKEITLYSASTMEDLIKISETFIPRTPIEEGSERIVKGTVCASPDIETYTPVSDSRSAQLVYADTQM